MKKQTKYFLLGALIVLFLSCVAMQAFAATSIKVLGQDMEYTGEQLVVNPPLKEGNQSTSNGSGTITWDNSSAKFTLTAQNSTYSSKLFGAFKYYAQNYTAKLTLTNPMSSGVVLKITYTTADIDGLENKTYEGVSLDPGSSLVFTVSSTATNPETKTSTVVSGTVTIKSVTIVENANISFASSSRGSYTYKLAAGSTATVEKGTATTESSSVTVGTKVTLTHGAADTGYTFYGWMGSGKLLGTTDGEYAINDDIVIYPVYLESDTIAEGAPFRVGENSYMFWHLAMADAKLSGSTVILTRDYTLPSKLEDSGLCEGHSYGDYTSGIDNELNYIISRGNIFAIPFDKDNTYYTNEPGDSQTYVKPSAFRTLTMASGTSITVDGALSVSSKILAGAGGGATGGSPIGPCGWISMKDGSSITVGTSGTLYAYGYITGTGSVIAKGNGTSGATVYECFQLGEYRGGTQSTQMKNGVFAVAQYYVQNIEVPLTLEAGASEKCWSKVTVTLLGAQGSDVGFIGPSGSMFSLTSGTVTKRYDGTTDRLIVDLKGTVNISSVVIQVSAKTIDSAQFVLSLTDNLTINIHDGSKVTSGQDLALIPGSELVIHEGGNFTIGEGKSLYVYDADQWEEFVYGEVDLKNETDYWLLPIIYAPGMEYTRTKADLKDALVLVNGTLDASKGYLYTTYGPMTEKDTATVLGLASSNGGANIYSTQAGTVILGTTANSYTYRYKQIEDKYYQIPVTSAKLKNGNGTYVNTKDEIAEMTTTGLAAPYTFTYCSDCMAWLCDEHVHAVNHATNVELGNGLNMYFAFWDPANPNKDWQNHFVKITHKDCVGKILKETTLYYDKNQWFSDTVNGHSACVVYYKELSAKQMGDTITVALYVAGEAEPIDTWSSSIQHYAMRMLKKYEADENKGTLRTILVDMLKYGAACQKEFQYNTDNLVDAGLSAVQQGWATKEVEWSETLPSGSSSHSANLIVDGNIQFAISGVNDLSRYSFKNHWGTQRDDQEFKPADGYFYISKLYVADARQVITITAGNTTWTDSVEAYCKRMIDSKQDTNDVCTAFMKFSDAAHDYLHDEENRV